MRKRTSQETVAKQRHNRQLWKHGEDISRDDQMRLLLTRFATRITSGGKITRVPLA